MNSRLLALILGASMIFAGACKEKGTGDEKISTDIVTNPNSATGEANPEDLPVFEFEKTTHDFGNIKEGEKVAYAFKFKNTGKTDLIISSASGSCGCTVPQYPKMPIPPGETGVIDVTFDSHGRQGKQHKQVTIVANTIPNTTVLNITGEVVANETKNK